jgi:hypothetical protein
MVGCSCLGGNTNETLVPQTNAQGKIVGWNLQCTCEPGPGDSLPDPVI